MAINKTYCYIVNTLAHLNDNIELFFTSASVSADQLKTTLHYKENN